MHKLKFIYLLGGNLMMLYEGFAQTGFCQTISSYVISHFAVRDIYSESDDRC